jgi:hypothetical protein
MKTQRRYIMKKIISVLLIFFTSSSITFAKEYESSFGFSINVPEHWLVLTPSEIKNNPDLFDFENADFGNIDKNLLKQVINKIKSGKVEYYFNQNTSYGTSSDNINIVKNIGRLPTTIDELNKQCNETGLLLSQYFGRKINMYQCKTTTINNKTFFLLEFDGALNGTRAIQYQFQKSPSVIIMITSTSNNKTTEIIRKEFNNMINTIKFKR